MLQNHFWPINQNRSNFSTIDCIKIFRKFSSSIRKTKTNNNLIFCFYIIKLLNRAYNILKDIAFVYRVSVFSQILIQYPAMHINNLYIIIISMDLGLLCNMFLFINNINPCSDFYDSKLFHIFNVCVPISVRNCNTKWSVRCLCTLHYTYT